MIVIVRKAEKIKKTEKAEKVIVGISIEAAGPSRSR